MSARKARVTPAECPQCGHNLKANDVGAWCENYPCRYVANRKKVAAAYAVAIAIWGDPL